MEHRFGQTSRREFLRVIAPLWVAIFSAKGSSRDTESYKIGCYTRPWDQYDYRTALDGIAEAGFAYAGIMTAKGPSWLIIHTGTPEEEVISVKNEARQRGLKIISLYAGEFNVQRSVDEGIQGLRRLIDYCALCECPNLMLAGTPETRLVQDYCRVVRECCEYAAAKNVQLAIKPHGGPNATGPQCRKIIERVGHPRFRLWYDPGNILYYSEGSVDPVEDSASVSGLVAGISVKDYRRPKDVMVTPGDGEVNFKGVFSNLRKGGFVTGPVVIECLARKETPAAITAEAKRARVFVEEILASL